MFKKIFLLIILFLTLLIFSFGYEHNEEVSYYDIQSEDYIQYLKSFNSAVDLGNIFMERFNSNNERLIIDLKSYINIDFEYNNLTGITFLTLIQWISQIIKILILPINALLRLFIYAFQQFSLCIYIFVSYLLWASGIRSVLIWVR